MIHAEVAAGVCLMGLTKPVAENSKGARSQPPLSQVAEDEVFSNLTMMPHA